MQTTHPKLFALKNAGLDAFLYAEVGAELNGSALTILSMIARLGRDPWAEAAGWARLPRTSAIQSLAQDIAQMPLVPSALAETRATAARLVQLLPAPGPTQGHAANAESPSVPAWLPVTIVYCALAFAMALSAAVMPKPPEVIATPTKQPMALSGAGTVPPVHVQPVAGLSAARPASQSR